MKTEVLKININKPETYKLKKVAEVLEKGGVIVFPTDTVYGLACSAFNNDARQRIYKLKGRSYSKPLVIMAGKTGLLGCLCKTSEKIRMLMKKFWPGPLTLVLEATDIGKLVMGGRENIGARIPDDSVALGLLKACTFPLATTSANPSSKPSAKSFKEAAGYFDGRVDLMIDGGYAKMGKESTVLDVTHFPYTIIRKGSLDKEELLKAVNHK
jgi:L-threonylcarbamoyladenylate synthase